MCDTKYRSFNGAIFVEFNNKQLDTATFIPLATGFALIKNERLKWACVFVMTVDHKHYCTLRTKSNL